MTELDIKELIEMKSKDPEKYKKYILEWKTIEQELKNISPNEKDAIKGRHTIHGGENYTKDYLEYVIKEWQDRGIIV